MWRTVIISSGERLNIKDNWLIVYSQKGETKVPVDDLYSVVIENRSAMLSVSVLTTLTQAGTHIIFCDANHLPTTISLPLNNHYRPYSVVKKQIEMSQVFRDCLWQKIVVQKIKNQSLCLKYVGVETKRYKEIEDISLKVKVGDITNREAVAAKKYFPYLFGVTFRRSDDDITNSALNYGYAIIRSSVAKTLASYGFNGAIGLHHISETNPFNLADDIMEPLRPIVDMWVDQECENLFETLTYHNRRDLIDLPNQIICMNNKKMKIRYAIYIYVKSLVSAINKNKVELLEIPMLIPFDEFFEETND